MLNLPQFKSVILLPVLKALNLDAPEAIELLIGTAAIESEGGTYLIEEGGSALGIYQMEPKTHDDIWGAFLPSHPKLTHNLMQVCKMSMKPVALMMTYNLFYATAMARIFYFRVKEAIPLDLKGQANFYKKHWNTANGKSTEEEYIESYNRFIGKPLRSKISTKQEAAIIKEGI